MDLTGLWKSTKACKNEKGIFLIHQIDKVVSIHGIGISKDKFNNIGFGRINETEDEILGVWEDTYYSANPQNCKKHSFKIKILSDKKLQSVSISNEQDFGYGDFEIFYTQKELLNK